jgi:hypothetical protein
MTSVVVAVAAARERTKTAVAAMALIGKLVGEFMEIIPPGAGRRVKNILVRPRSSQPARLLATGHRREIYRS